MDDDKLPIEALPSTTRLAKLLYHTLEGVPATFMWNFTV